jgi:putative nucleotidyltransferase with HDIG domain
MSLNSEWNVIYMNVNIKSLVEGMITTQDIFTKHGTLLLPKGTALTNDIIFTLMKFGVEKINVMDYWIKSMDYIKFNEVYTKSLNKAVSMFGSVKNNQSIEISGFEDIVDELLPESESKWSILLYMKRMEEKDEYTFHHSVNVSIIAMLMGGWLGYTKDEIKLLGIASMLHDIGKTQIPNNILKKPDFLTDMEFSIIKNHPKLGLQLLKKSGIDNDSIKNVVLSHHERMNGEGYPFGLVGSYISKNAKIVSICDVYDAVTSKRDYKQKLNPLLGLDVILEGSYKGLDPYLSKIFLNNVSIAYNGCNVILSNGDLGKIIKVPVENPTKPWVIINDNFYDLAKCSDIEIVDIL